MIAAACCLKTLLQQCKSSQAPPSGKGLVVNLSSAGSMTSIQVSHPLTPSPLTPHPSPRAECGVLQLLEIPLDCGHSTLLLSAVPVVQELGSRLRPKLLPDPLLQASSGQPYNHSLLFRSDQTLH